MEDLFAAIVAFSLVMVVLSFNTMLDAADQEKREACEISLPRDKHCVWVSIPEDSVQEKTK